MKKLALSIASLFACAAAFAQNITDPKFDARDDYFTTITKIETDKQYTVITFESTTPNDNFWEQVNKDMYIRTGNDVHYNYVKSEGIAVAPEKTTLAKAGDKLTFKVFFNKIPAATKAIDVIERAPRPEGSTTFFNFYHVSLTESRPKTKSKTVEVTLTPPPPPMDMHNAMDMGGMMNAMAPMMGVMTKSMLDAQLEYFKQPGKLQEIAHLTKSYFDALVKEGFTEEQALKIITADSLMPKMTTTGK